MCVLIGCFACETNGENKVIIMMPNEDDDDQIGARECKPRADNGR